MFVPLLSFFCILFVFKLSHDFFMDRIFASIERDPRSYRNAYPLSSSIKPLVNNSYE